MPEPLWMGERTLRGDVRAELWELEAAVPPATGRRGSPHSPWKLQLFQIWNKQIWSLSSWVAVFRDTEPVSLLSTKKDHKDVSPVLLIGGWSSSRYKGERTEFIHSSAWGKSGQGNLTKSYNVLDESTLRHTGGPSPPSREEFGSPRPYDCCQIQDIIVGVSFFSALAVHSIN